MLISTRGYNFLKVMIFFAFTRKRSFSIREISERLNISDKVLEQVMSSLKNAGIMASKRGPNGGYWMDEAGMDLSIMELFEKTGEKMEVIPVERKEKKDLIDDVLTDISQKIGKSVTRSLENISIRDLRKNMSDKVASSGYNYII
jgi:Rrf2 family transcriptional regulator, cysteine metabolism repressor